MAALIATAWCVLGTAAMAIEEPTFRLVERSAPFEIRDYPEHIVAETTIAADRQAAISAGFRRLAGYIFGGNQAKASIAMTAPVMQAADPSAPSHWVIQFPMPRAYSFDALPKPNDATVKVRRISAMRCAVVTFSGLTQNGDLERERRRLAGFIASRGLTIVGAPILARYDPPWTPWFMRRNELLQPVSQTPERANKAGAGPRIPPL